MIISRPKHHNLSNFQDGGGVATFICLPMNWWPKETLTGISTAVIDICNAERQCRTDNAELTIRKISYRPNHSQGTLLIFFEACEKINYNQVESRIQHLILIKPKLPFLLLVILGLVSAFRYLFNEREHCVIHCDIKPSNVTLGESHWAKLGDFGLAYIVDHGTGWQTTNGVLGTATYFDPVHGNMWSWSSSSVRILTRVSDYASYNSATV